MALTFNLVDNPNHLLCEVHGEHEGPQNSIDYFLEILLHCRSSEIPKVLIDMRETWGTINAIDKILFYEQIIDKYEIYLNFGGLPIRIVFLVNPNIAGNYNPGLDVAKRRNFPAIIATDLQEAIDWLGFDDAEHAAIKTSAIFEY